MQGGTSDGQEPKLCKFPPYQALAQASAAAAALVSSGPDPGGPPEHSAAAPATGPWVLSRALSLGKLNIIADVLARSSGGEIMPPGQSGRSHPCAFDVWVLVSICIFWALCPHVYSQPTISPHQQTPLAPWRSPALRSSPTQSPPSLRPSPQLSRRSAAAPR